MTEDEAKQKAIEEVALNSDACTPPELETSDLEAIVSASQVASVWQPSTVYPAGSVVVPDALSNIAYRAAKGGTSGAEAPSWPDPTFYSNYGCSSWSGDPAALFCCCGGRGQVSDGGVVWHAQAPIGSLYDVDSATSRAWLLKAARAATLIQTSSAGQATALQQVFTHCRQMAIDWSPFNVA
jgi:hypothetical protein